jgi:hypothetical protein
MKNVPIGGTPRVKPHTAGEIQQFNLVREREAGEVAEQLDAHVGRMGAPGVWGRILKAAVPAVAGAGLDLVKAIHPESPGGGKITRAEFKAVGKRFSQRVERALEKEFAAEIVDEPAPEKA